MLSPPQAYTISSRSPTLLREVARGIASGQIVHSRVFECEEEIYLVFLPLSLMHESQRIRLRHANLGLVYEWRANASPEATDEYPEFLSCSFLNHEDADQVLTWAKEPLSADSLPALVEIEPKNPYPHKFQDLTDNGDLYEAMFRAGDHLYNFVIARMAPAGQFSCCFALCNPDCIPAHFGISGTGNQHRVFSTVIALLRDWIRLHRPDTLSFVAKEKSRDRLYRRLARRFATAWGYLAHEERNANGHTIFAFDRITGAEPHCRRGSQLSTQVRTKANALLSIAERFCLTRTMTLREPDQSHPAE